MKEGAEKPRKIQICDEPDDEDPFTVLCHEEEINEENDEYEDECDWLCQAEKDEYELENLVEEDDP